MAKKCTARKRMKDSEWFKEKMLLAESQEAGVLQATIKFNTYHVDAYDSDCDDKATANAIFMSNLSPVGSLNDDTVAPRYDSNIQEQGYIENIVSNNESYDELPEKNDMILSVIEQMKSQVEKYNMVNQEKQSEIESLTSDIERYKDRVRVLGYAVKDGHSEQEAYLNREYYTVVNDRNIKVAYFEKQVSLQNTQIKDLNNHILFLKKNLETFKQESSEKYEKNISEIVDLI
ncbi:hypothetical protein Tco_1535209 [Tanacetum coccineum]